MIKFDLNNSPWNVPRIFCAALLLLLIVDSAQAAVAFRSAANNRQSSTASGGTLTVNKPTGTISGDVMLASIAVVTNTSTVTAPAGWVLVQSTNQATGNTSRLYTYYKVAGAAEPASYAWTFSGANNGTVAGIASFTGVDTASPIDVSASQTTASSTSHTAPSVTTTVAGDMLVTIHSFASSRTWTPPGGMTEAVDRYSRNGGTGGGGVSLGMNYEARPATGATGTRTAVASGSADRGSTHSIALRAVVVVTTPGDFSIYDTSTAPATAIDGLIKTKVSAQAFTLDIAALNAAKTALLTTFTGTVKVEVLNTSNNSAALDANGCRSSWTVLQTLSPNPTFVAANNGRLTTASFNQGNAYPDVRLRVTFPATGTPTKIGCSTDNFAVRPASFTGLTVRDAGWQTAGTTRNLTNTAATGGVAHKAGQPFRIDAVVQNAAGAGITYGAAAGNYGGLPTAQLITCLLPVAACTLGVLDELGVATTWTAGAAGSFFTTTASYDDAGSFTMNLIDTAFSAVDAGDGTPADCSVSGQYICSSTTPNVGRFVPDAFELVNADSATDPLVDYAVDTWLPLPAPQLRTFNTTDATCNAAAAPPRRSFTYIGQPFGYVSVPQITFKALNASGTPITNYSGALMKLTAAGVAQTYTALTGTLDTSLALAAPTVTLNANYTNGSDSLVVGSIAVNAADRLAFARTVPVAPFNAAITLDMTAQDSSENTVAGNGIITATAPVSFNPLSFDSSTEMRFGRLKLENANGSEFLNLPVPMETQFWSAAATFTTNTTDHCTTIVPGNILLNNPQVNLLVSETGVTVSGAFLNGRSTNLRLNLPGAGNNGSVNLCVDLGIDTAPVLPNTAPVCVATTPANLPWLQGRWSEINFDDDPVVRGTFGVYRNADQIIYMREMY